MDVAFLTGDGDMAARVRALDWSGTPLGDPSTWPPSLRASASICLSSRFPILVWWGRDHVMIYNDGYSAMLGAKHPSALGKPGREVWWEIWPTIGPMLDGVLEHGRSTWSENQMLPLHRNGFVEECYFTFSYSPIVDDTGAIGGVFTAVSEVTEQIISPRRLGVLHRFAQAVASCDSIDEACRRAAGALATDREDVPFSLIYRETDTGSFRLVASHGVEPGGELAPLECTDCEPWRLADAAAARTPLVIEAGNRALPAGVWPEPTRAAITQAVGGTGDGGAVLVTGCSSRLALDAAYRGFHEVIAGHLASAIATARSHEQDRARTHALAAFDRAKTTFFSNISHELRTPLALILGPVEDALASEAGTLGGDDLAATHRNAKRLKKLVNQLLDFARIEAQRVEVRYQPTDLAALTIDLASAFHSTFERGGLELRVDCPPLRSPVHVDPEMWEKIVLNLISNAFKYTFEGHVEVSLRDRDDHVELRVRDTGVGIESDHLPRLFERFHRIEGTRSRSHEGSGIGLALVADLVHLHGGDIDASSVDGEGTELVVTMPRVPRDATGATVTSSGAGKDAFVAEASQWLTPLAPERGAEPAAPLFAARILLADDNADMRAYISRLLGKHWAVTAVRDGAEALASARAAPPDLVLADVMMPNLDGFGLVRDLRADPQLATIPIILLSARAGDEAVAEGLRSGADDYVIKPFTASQLTVRVEAQLATSRARAVAYDERRRLYAALMHAPAVFCILRGPDLVIDVANEACLRIWGRDRSVFGRALFDAMPELRDQPIPALLQEVRDTRESRRLTRTHARVDAGATGEAVDVYFDVVYEPILDATGAVDSILVFAVDVTHQVLARQSVEAALADAHQANRAKDEFLALLGHELRNPLAPIMTALDVMKLRDDRDVRREREVIERQSTHLTRLVDDLLDISRITRGTVELSRTRTRLAELIARSAEVSAPLYEQKRHRLDIDVPADLAIDVDGERMVQVVANLLTNAAKYTPHGGEVSLRAYRDAASVVVVVRDNGVGIAADVLPSVFDMFVQERQGIDRQRGGLGLGLAIVRALVRAHGGEVAARSEGRDRGSEFEVRIPAAADGVTTTGEIRTGRGPIPVATTRGRVLIVDDNADAATLLAEAITAMGHETCVAFDGPAALRANETFRPDIALLDIGLPVMDGYELAGRLRTEQAPAIRLVAVTGYGQPGDREQSRRAGFEAHVVKPVDIAQLAATIERLISR